MELSLAFPRIGHPATCYNQNRLLKLPAINPVISSRETEGHLNPLEHKGLHHAPPGVEQDAPGGSAAWGQVCDPHSWIQIEWGYRAVTWGVPPSFFVMSLVI